MAEPIDEGESTDQGKNRDQDERNLNLDTGMDLEAENWARSLEGEALSQDYIKDY